MKNILINTNELYSTRVLIFIETKPQSNIYKQLLLTKEEFKNITSNIGKVVKEKDKNGVEIIELNESRETYKLPDLQEINE